MATNQCLGGSTSYVNIAEHFNEQLRKCKSNKIQKIDSTAFSIAINGTEARLYILWKHNDLDYYIANVDSFLLQKPEHYIEFRKYVRNIIDWGKDKRLGKIQASLDKLLEEGRKKASSAAKSRQPPSDGSAASGKKRKPSSSGRGSRSKQEQGGEADGSHWEPDGTSSHDTHEGLSSHPQQQSFVSADYTPHTQQQIFVNTDYTPHPQQQSFVNTDYTPQAGGGPALPGYLYHGDYQQNQSRAPVSFGPAAEPLESFASDPYPHSHETPSWHTHGHRPSSYRHRQHGPAEDGARHDTGRAAAGSFPQASPATAPPATAPAGEPLAAPADDTWIWSNTHENWYYLTEDGVCEWYKKPRRGSRK